MQHHLKLLLFTVCFFLTFFSEAQEKSSLKEGFIESFDLKTVPTSLILDLGRVGDIAEVTMNGITLDTLWKAPYRVDVSKTIRKGKNQLEIKVTNEWTNRLIGDRSAPADKKVLSSYTNPFGGQYRLAESGLMGPVKLVAVSIEQKK